MNIQKLRSILRSKSKEYDVSVQSLYDVFFFEEFLKRLSKSSLNNKYVLKGGFLLENILGVEKRSTLDIDLSYRVNTINKDNLTNEINLILNNKINEDIIMSIKSIDEIINDGELKGYAVKINGSFYNVKKIFNIDIAVGDYITPKPNILDYQSIIENDISFNILAYNIETIFAEKIEAIIEKGINNTRMKDYYDIYLINEFANVDYNVLKDAIINTFERRETKYDKNYIKEIIDELLKSDRITTLFNKFIDKSKYANVINIKLIYHIIINIFNNYIWEKEYKIKLDNLIIIRHGEDDQNTVGGWSDNELTVKGVSQVEDLSIDISKIIKKDHYIISSDLVRTKQTSKIISNNLSVEIIYDKRLRETNNGDLKNISTDTFLKDYTDFIFSKLKMDQTYPNGESPILFYKRVYDYFVNLNEKYENKKVVLITHKGVYGVIKSIITGVKWSNQQEYQIDYGKYKILK